MTKVKTILAEFCSAKDILAINRLGLLKKEERESQPIPWRHRLPNAERRELVKSEMRTAIRPSRSRVSSRDKVKAFQSAANPKDSKMGECLYSIHISGDPSLSSSLTRIHRERSRLEAREEYNKQQFISRSHSLNHEPLILVEREPSQVVKTRAMLMRQHGIDPQVLMKPSHMRPLESQFRTPSTLTTIDAFTADTRKKRNVWEKATDDLEPPKFRSAVRPFTRLNQQEVQQLRMGRALHKPSPEPDKATPPSNRLPTPPKDPRPKPPPPKEAKGDNDISPESVFITQQYTGDKNLDNKHSHASYNKGFLEKESVPNGNRSSANIVGRSTSSGGFAAGGKTVTFAGTRSESSFFQKGTGGVSTVSSRSAETKKSSTSNKKPTRPITVATDSRVEKIAGAQSSGSSSHRRGGAAAAERTTHMPLTPTPPSDDKQVESLSAVYSARTRRRKLGQVSMGRESREKQMNFLSTLLESPPQSP